MYNEKVFILNTSTRENIILGGQNVSEKNERNCTIAFNGIRYNLTIICKWGVVQAASNETGEKGYSVTNYSPEVRLEVSGPNGYKAPVYCYNAELLAPSVGGKPVSYEKFNFYDGMKTAADLKGDPSKVNKVMTVLLLGYPNNVLSQYLTPLAKESMETTPFSNAHTLDEYMWESTQQAVWAIDQPDGNHIKNKYIKAIVDIANKMPLDEETANATNITLVDDKNHAINKDNPLVINSKTNKSQQFSINTDYHLPISLKNIPEGIKIYSDDNQPASVMFPGKKYYVSGNTSGTVTFNAEFFRVIKDNFFVPLDSTGTALKYQNTVNTSYEGKIVNIPVVKNDNTTRDVIISKQDINGKEIAGAELTLSSDNTEIEHWTSEEGKNHSFNADIDKEYVLTEVAAPDGFKKAESITFRVNKEGNVEIKKDNQWIASKDNKVIMIDEYSKKQEITPSKKDVIISKQDINGKEIAGAKLTLSSNNTEIEHWTSEEGKNHSFNADIDKEYVLTEVAAPDGFKKAESITFRVNKEGNVEIKKDNQWITLKDNKVIMIDEYSNAYGMINNGISNNNNHGSNQSDTFDIGKLQSFLPQTGHNITIVLSALGLLLLAIAVILIIKRRKAA